jgi:PAS domain S-box-containing protein
LFFFFIPHALIRQQLTTHEIQEQQKQEWLPLRLFAVLSAIGLVSLSHLAYAIDPVKVPDFRTRYLMSGVMLSAYLFSRVPQVPASIRLSVLKLASLLFGLYACWVAYFLNWGPLEVITLVTVLNGGMLSYSKKAEVTGFISSTFLFLFILALLPSEVIWQTKAFVVLCLAILVGFTFFLLLKREGLVRQLIAKEKQQLLSQEMIAAVIESSRSIIWACDRNNQLIAFNRAFINLHQAQLGFSPVTGNLFLPATLFPGESSKLSAFLEALRRGEHLSEELAFTGRDGQKCWFLFNGNPMTSDPDSGGYAVFLSDISEARQKNQRLQRLQHAISNTRESIAIIDKAGKLLFANSAFTTITGLQEGDGYEALGKLVKDPFLPMTAFSALSQGASWEGEFLLNDRNNQSLVVQAKADGMFNREGRLNGAVLFLTDISAFRQAQALNKSILECSQDGIMALRTVRDELGAIIDFEWTHVNPSSEAMVGRKGGELLGKRLLEEMPGNLPDGLFEVYKQVVETGKSVQFEHFYNHEHIRKVWFRISVVKMGDGFAVTFSDITEQKQTELELQKISLVAEKTIAGVIISDAEGRVEWVNEAFTKISGYSAEEMMGKKPGAVLQGPGTNPETNALMRQALNEKKPFSGEILNYHKSGEPYWLSLNINPIFNSRGELEKFIAIENDITVSKLAEVELVKAKQEAEEATRAKSEFLATMSHEIRTPMNAVIGLTSLLMDSDLNAEQRDYLNTIRTSGDNLLVIINDILDYSKIESGKLLLENKEINLYDLVEECLDLMAPRTYQHRVELTSHFDPGLPEIITGDPTRLRQILVNLLSNAIKFTPNGDISVWVTKGNCNLPERICIQFEVRDTGLGIPSEKQKLLFRPFSQADASITRKFGGTGLGLAISSQLTRLMKGEIWVQSEPGEGSSFFFTIETDDLPQPPARFVVPNAVTVGLLGATSLQAHMLTGMVQRMGMIPVAGNLLNPAQAWGNNPVPDVVLIDHELKQTLEENGEKHPVPGMQVCVWLEGYSSLRRKGDEQLAFRLSKPAKRQALFQILAKALQFQGQSVTAAPATPDAGDSGWQALRVLIVEDNLVNQKVATKMLQRLGCSPEIASNGQQAVNMLLNQSFDVVFMDVQMPEMDGLTATRIIRQRAYSQPVIIAMTANALQGDRELCLEAGMNDYISKPIKLDDIRTALQKWFSHLQEHTGTHS